MRDETAVYVAALQRSLKAKLSTLEEILALTKQQEKALTDEKTEYGLLDAQMAEKEKLIERMQLQDENFDRLFRRVSSPLKDHKERYREEILAMQDLIRRITDNSVKIQAQESKNKERFASFTTRKRGEIRHFKTNNKAASAYYRNMTQQGYEWQTSFVDQKK